MKQKERIVIKTNYEGNDIELTFRQPNKLNYSEAISNLSKQDYYEAIDILVQNCYLQTEGDIDLINEEPLKMQISDSILLKFLDFSSVDISTNYTGEKYKAEYKKLKKDNELLFTVTVNDDSVFFIKSLDRTDYKNIFNKSISSPLQALDYIYQELKVGGDDIYDNDKYYVSCFQISDYLLKYKSNTVKKK